MAKAFGIITAASNRFKVEGLQEHRPVGAFSIIGRFRLIDYPISNLCNSDIDRISVCISGNPRSLVEHLGTGRSYNINSKRGMLQTLFHDEGNINPIYNTDIACFNEHLKMFEKNKEEYVVILPSNMVYVQNYKTLLEQHIESGADITLLYHKVEGANEQYIGCNTLTVNRQKGVEKIERNEGTTSEVDLFMDSYIMKRTLFIDLCRKAASISSVYHMSQVISKCCSELDVRAVQHKGYLAVITSLKSYYDSNLALTDINMAKQLMNPSWPIYTKTNDSCPTRYYDGAKVSNSLISNGCKIEGTIENSVIGRGCKIGKGSVVKNCVMLSNTTIADGITVENQVIDKWVEIKNVKEVISDPANPGYIRRDDII